MGLLRVFLAMTVAFQHYIGHPRLGIDFVIGPGANLAVEVFFIISGFYMALILGEKYTGPGCVRKFYINRVLRLYPTYYIILAGYLMVAAYLRLTRGGWRLLATQIEALFQADWFTQAYMFLANLFILGQDATFFMDFCPDTGALCQGGPGAMPAWYFLAIPQAWSIELEMLFYVFAPLFIRWRTSTLLVVSLVLAALRAYVGLLDVDNTSWELRFPLTEVWLFMLGVVAYRIYKRIQARNVPRRWLTAVFVAFMAYIVLYPLLPGLVVKKILLYPMAFLAVPCIFQLTKKNSFDRITGELSYPIYLNHNVVTEMVVYWFKGPVAVLLTLSLTFLSAYVLHQYLLSPIERYRQRRVYTG